MVPAKQQIIASRSFGRAVISLEELEESVATHIARACEKLRTQIVGSSDDSGICADQSL